jgi:hypothetical protein
MTWLRKVSDFEDVMKGLRPSLLSAGKLKKKVVNFLKVDNLATKHPLRKVSDFEDVMKGLRPSLPIINSVNRLWFQNI